MSSEVILKRHFKQCDVGGKILENICKWDIPEILNEMFPLSILLFLYHYYLKSLN